MKQRVLAVLIVLLAFSGLALAKSFVPVKVGKVYSISFGENSVYNVKVLHSGIVSWRLVQCSNDAGEVDPKTHPFWLNLGRSISIDPR